MSGCVDLLVAAGILALVYLVLAAWRFVLGSGRLRWTGVDALHLFVGWAVLVLYLAVGWSSTGRTVGNQVMGLRVVTNEGRRLGFGRALLRGAMYAAFPLGLFWCAVSRKRRSVQDLLVATTVVYDWRAKVPPSA